jgi:hypothetical protein
MFHPQFNLGRGTRKNQTEQKQQNQMMRETSIRSPAKSTNNSLNLGFHGLVTPLFWEIQASRWCLNPSFSAYL